MKEISKEEARYVARMVLRNLDDRAGFDHWWGEIDAETQREIMDDLTGVVRDSYTVVANT